MDELPFIAIGAATTLLMLLFLWFSAITACEEWHLISKFWNYLKQEPEEE